MPPQFWSERVIFLSKIKNKANVRPANLFFVELIIVLLFFSFSAAVILRIFAAADSRQKLSDITEKAVICSQSVAEAFSVSGNLSDTLDIVFDADKDYGSSAEIALDDDFNVNDSGRIKLLLIQRDNPTSAGVLSFLEMSFSLDGKEIFYLECSSYIPGNGGEDID